jgi:fructose-bisphosphate aldolase class I
MAKNIEDLMQTMQEMVVPGKGILAADESPNTVEKRLQAINLESTAETRRAYRDMLLTTPNINQFICGVILHDETLYQSTLSEIPFPQFLQKHGIVPGIKVDKGLIPLTNSEGNFVTEGLDGLGIRLDEYKNKGARFAKWRAVFAISDENPTKVAIKTNAELLARYAAICQEHGIVPIVEPELLLDGEHTIERCATATTDVLHGVFHALHRHSIMLEYMILKPSMVLSGNKCPVQASITEVAETTLKVLRETVPAAVRSINFLSGGQTSQAATAHLNAMNAAKTVKPWYLSFSYSRALQDTPLKVWKGSVEHIQAAQKAFYRRARFNSLATLGTYNPDMEQQGD